MVAGPEVHARGFAENDDVFEPVKARLADALSAAAVGDGNADTYALQQIVRRTVGKWVSETFRRRPMIIPVVIEA